MPMIADNEATPSNRDSADNFGRCDKCGRRDYREYGAVPQDIRNGGKIVGVVMPCGCIKRATT